MKCNLVKVLSKLSKSSLEAVDDESIFDEFKQYMHIENRPLERDLRRLIEKTNQYDLKKLILLCGNVGDGKSHMISVLKNSEEKLLANYRIHNDATASILPYLTPEQTLQRVLEDFDDSHIDNDSKEKVVLAINLGTLNKFLDSEEGRGFGRLKQYVEDKKILSQVLSETEEISEEIFGYVNFSDYHLYNLAEDGVHSPYMREILERIVQKKRVKEIPNPFYSAWEECCSCEGCKYCSVKMNYEMLQDKRVQSGLEQIVLVAVIKNKLLVSSRALYNFIYNILVPNSFKPGKVIDVGIQKKAEELLETAMPMLLYESAEESLLLEAVTCDDPIKQGGGWLDEQAAKFHIVEGVGELLQSLSEDNTWVNLLCSLEDKIERTKLYKYFARFNVLSKQGQVYTEMHKAYREYLHYFYLIETGQSKELKELYEKVKEAIYKWSGSEETNKLGIGLIGRKYRILGQIELKADISHLRERKEKELEKFGSCIQLGFQKRGSAELKQLPIDYDLYEMILRMQQGYQPSIQDGSDYVRFVSFIKEIEQLTEAREQILIGVSKSGELYKLSEEDFERLKFSKQ